MDAKDTKTRIEAAYKLLSQNTTTKEKFESIRSLVKGINPSLDRVLTSYSDAFSKIGKLEKGEVIELTAEYLPENSEEEKKRKKYLLVFIRFWKDLKGEVERVKNELEKGRGESKSTQESIFSFAKIAAFAKGPFGIVTIVAVVIVAVLSLSNTNKNETKVETNTSFPITASQQPTSTPQVTEGKKKTKIKAIKVGEKLVPISELKVATGPECMSRENQSSHYHAKDGRAAKALDGSLVSDPGGCGLGKVDELPIQEVESN